SKLRDFLKSHTTAELKALFTEQAIEPYSINSIERVTFRDAEGHKALLAECEELCRIASEIDCPYIIVVPGLMPENASRELVIEESVRVLTELSAVAARQNV